MIIMNKTIIVMIIMKKLAAPRIFLVFFFLKRDTFLVYEIGKKDPPPFSSQVKWRGMHTCCDLQTSLLCPPRVTERALYHCDQGYKWVPTGFFEFVILVHFLSLTNYIACHSSLFYQILDRPNDPKMVGLASLMLEPRGLVYKDTIS